jgi:hypothetical protein
MIPDRYVFHPSSVAVLYNSKADVPFQLLLVLLLLLLCVLSVCVVDVILLILWEMW